MKRKPIFVLLVILLVAFVAIGVNDLRNKNHKVELQKVQLENRGAQIKKLEIDHRKLNQDLETELKSNTVDAERIKALEAEKARLDAETKRLEAELQAKLQKRENDRIAQQNAVKAPVRAVANAVAPKASAQSSGSCADWIAQAGISEVASANELIRRESGCNPNAVNRSSGACGVAQELPCGKSGCSMGDGACQVKWMNKYVAQRYGSWGKAIAFHNANNWY